jgi:hypothetical protein
MLESYGIHLGRHNVPSATQGAVVTAVQTETNSVALVSTFADRGVSHGECGRSPMAVISISRPDFTRTLALSTSLEHSHKLLH